MREKTTKEETRVVKTVLEKRFCDICKKEIKKPALYSVESVIIEAETGNCYPGDSDTTTIEFDICFTCFNNTLKPFIESFGATPTITES